MTREYFSFSRRERAGIITLVCLLFAASAVPKFFADSKPATGSVSRQDTGKLRSNLYFQQRDTAHQPKFSAQKNADKQGVARDGHFQKSSRAAPTYNGRRNRWPQRAFEINRADTSAFIALPGIGSKLAARIVLFRDKLGGFHSADQIAEVYGLADSVFNRIKPFLHCDERLIRKLNINAASREELKNHPYIRWQNADAIIAYRDAHGKFASADDMKKIINTEENMLEKIVPYLKFD